MLEKMSDEAIEQVTMLRNVSLQLPQVEIETLHMFHAGTYARTIKIPKGVVLSGALIKIPTVVIINGDCRVFGEGGWSHLVGHCVLGAEAGRQQAFVAVEDTYVTMMFATSATSVEEAEAEFTDEVDLLMTRRTLPYPDAPLALGET